MRSRVSWCTNGQGWLTATIKVNLRPIFIALMRERERSWRWVAYANGVPLGTFDGLANAKRNAPKLAEELNP